MKWIKQSVILASLIAFFVLGSSSTVIPIEKSITKEQRYLSAETIQSVGLIQSITASQIQLVVKENKTSFSNSLLQLFEFPTLFIPEIFSLFLTQQDVNRCENVSQLLFPYHIFW